MRERTGYEKIFPNIHRGIIADTIRLGLRKRELCQAKGRLSRQLFRRKTVNRGDAKRPEPYQCARAR